MQSRYYDPEIGRFVNADVLISTKKVGVGCNIFAYCYNNPINYFDTAGTDAIWIQEEESAEGQGHTGLMVQDEHGNWFYFYWGPAPEYEADPDLWKLSTGVPNGAYYVQCTTNVSSQVNLRTTSGVIAVVDEMFKDEERNRSSLITHTVYIEGDFQKTHQYLQTLMKNGISSEKYNLILNNCVQKSMYALSLSDSRFTPFHIIPRCGKLPLIIPAVHPNLEYYMTFEW